MKIYEKNYNYLVLIFILVLLLDPTNKIFKLKEILLLLLILQFLFLYRKISKDRLVLFFSYYILPNLYAFFMTLINNIQYNFEFVKASLLSNFIGIFLLILSPISKGKLLNIFIKALKIYTIIYMFVVIAYLFLPTIFSLKIYQFSMEFGNIMIAPKIVFDYLPMIFYKTSPVLVIYFSYLLYNKKTIFLVIVGSLLMISGTAANLLSIILILIFYIFSKLLKKVSNSLLILMFGITSVLGILICSKVIFSSSDLGNTIKYNDLQGYLFFWKQNIDKFIFGAGLGSEFYSYGRDRVVYTTELTYFEIIRIYGIIIGSIINFILIFPIVKLIKIKSMNWLFISYLAYLFIGGTNPLIFSSTGSLVIIFVYSYLMAYD